MTKAQRIILSRLYDTLSEVTRELPSLKKDYVYNEDGEEVFYGDVEENICNAMEILSDFINS